ncbi:hypothetical protein D3C75_1179630 [compost metagenome]
MARVTIARSTASLASVELVTQAANSADDMQFQNNGSQLLYVDNGSGSSVNVTVPMAADKHGRTGQKVIAVPAGEQRFIGPFDAELYNQSGYVFVDFSVSTDITVGVLSLQS